MQNIFGIMPHELDHEQLPKKTSQLYLGPTPCFETCVQVSSTSDYLEDMRKQCEDYRNMLIKRFPIPHGITASFEVLSNDHDFGQYLSVYIVFDPHSNDAIDFAYFVEENLPVEWEDDRIMTIDSVPQESILDEFIREHG